VLWKICLFKVRSKKPTARQPHQSEMWCGRIRTAKLGHLRMPHDSSAALTGGRRNRFHRSNLLAVDTDLMFRASKSARQPPVADARRLEIGPAPVARKDESSPCGAQGPDMDAFFHAHTEQATRQAGVHARTYH